MNKILLALIVLFFFARVIKLDYDFPSGITNYGVLLTDEGWYSSGAVNKITTGSWRIEKDFNPMVNMPILHIVQYAVFSVAGMSIFTARLTVVFFFGLLLFSLYKLMVKISNRSNALFSVFLVSANYLLFAYSRLAILEIPMISLVVTSIWVSTINKKWSTVLAACIMSIAVLTKTIAICGIPVLFAVGFINKDKFRMFTPVIVPLVIVGIYNIWIVDNYYVDYKYFKDINYSGRIGLSIINIIDVFKQAFSKFPFVISAILLSGSMMATRASLKKQNIFIPAVLIVSYSALLFITGYHPPRYIIPLFIPLAMIVSVMINGKNMKMAIVLFVIVSNGYSIISYLYGTKSGYRDSCRDISSLIHRKELSGGMSKTVSLETGIRAVTNKIAGSPGYLITNGNRSDQKEYGKIKLKKKYKIYNKIFYLCEL